MMNVIVYEPGMEGHRSVYMSYIVDAFHTSGCNTMVVKQNYRRKARELVQLAVDNQASIIFVCTLDGLWGWLLVLGWNARAHGVKIAGIYYLFNNLREGWKKWFWNASLRSGVLCRVFVPDLMFGKPDGGKYMDKVYPIADPWDARCLQVIARDEAREHCGVSANKACVFLLFGEISPRKGVRQVLAALESWDFDRRQDVMVMLAGRLAAATEQEVLQAVARRPLIAHSLKLETRWIEESEHSYYFCAAAFLCAFYPRYFKVSISTVIRSLAVGRPVLVGDQGMIGSLVRQHQAGLVCDSESNKAVLKTMEQAYDMFMTDQARYQKMGQAGAEIAAISEVKNMKNTIATWIKGEEFNASR